MAVSKKVQFKVWFRVTTGKIAKRLWSITKKLLPVLIVVLLISGIIRGYFLNQEFKVLQVKDPDGFDLMMKEIRQFKMISANKRFKVLEALTQDEVILIHYNQRKKRWQEDEKYRRKEWASELTSRKITRDSRKLENNLRYKGIVKEREKKDLMLLTEKWQKMESWEKGLVLREKCIKYLDLEDKKNPLRLNARALPRNASLLNQPGARPPTGPNLCERWIPIGHDEHTVAIALDHLKMEMNYFYFISLLDELGIPVDQVFTFSGRHSRMTGDFVDS
ncbi:MAG: hypothetical protein ACE5EK_08250 [Nitrospinales bacterium]